jgi:hypothetical protein
MAVSVGVRFNVGSLTSRLDHSAHNVPQLLRASVNRAAFESKRAFRKAVPPDAAGPRTSPGKENLRATVRASVGSLTASFVVSNKPWKKSPRVISLKKGNQHRKGGMTISTFAVSGGPSANLSSPKFFRIEANGGRVILSRYASAAGKKRGYAGKTVAKAIYAAAPKTLIAVPTNSPSKVWRRTAGSALRQQIESRLQVVFNGGGPGADSPLD